MWLALANRLGIGDELARELASIVRFAEDLHARMSSSGIAGLDGALAAHARLRSVLDGVSANELAEMSARIAALAGRLAEILERLERLRRVKTAVGV